MATSTATPPGASKPALDIRQAVTRRCSGYTRGEDCKFSLLLDVAESEVWGGGLVTISHTCVNTEDIVTECGGGTHQVSERDTELAIY